MKKLIVMVFLSLSLMTFGQSDNVNIFDEHLNSIENKAILSPETNQFTVHGFKNVNLNIGKPDIHIPIYTIKGKSIEMPINLYYDATGIKVNDEATWAGLGWHLNAGGTIIRNVNGLPDDENKDTPSYDKHYLPSIRHYIDNYPNGLHSGQFGEVIGYMRDFETKLIKGNVDSQADFYNINVLNINDKFFIDYENNLGICISNPNIKIIPLFSNNSESNNKIIIGFIVTDEFGVAYEFKDIEVTTKNRQNLGICIGCIYNSAWRITKIISPNERDVIDFNYGNEDYESTLVPNSILAYAYNRLNVHDFNSPTYPQYVNIPNSSEMTGYTIITKKLESIDLNSERVLEINLQTNPRLDLLSGFNAIDEIIVRKGSVIHKKIKFKTSYFESNLYSVYEQFKKRLKLDEIVIKDSNNLKDEKYDFEYIGNGNIMLKGSNSQDFWGYFNDRNNVSLIPSTNENVLSNSHFNNRDTNNDPNIVGLGTLKKIKYPTGGFTIFNYETNNINYTSQNTSSNIIFSNYLIGGQLESGELGYGLSECYEGSGYEPFGAIEEFSIVENNNYQLQLKTQNTNIDLIGRPHYLYIAIFKSNEYSSFNACTFYDNNNIQFFKIIDNNSSLINNINNEFIYQLNLPVGDYKVLILNNRPNINLTTHLFGYTNTQNTYIKPVGGLRIQEMIDYKNEGLAFKSKKFIYYDVASHGLGNNTLSSGILHLKPVFEEWMTKKPRINQEIVYSFLKRTPYNRVSNDFNHIAYSIVTELNTNFDSPNLNFGFIVNNFKNETVATPIDYPAIPNKINQLNGKLLTQKKYNKDFKLMYSKTNNYSEEFRLFTPLYKFLKSNEEIKTGHNIIRSNNPLDIYESYIKSPISYYYIPGGNTPMNGVPLPGGNINCVALLSPSPYISLAPNQAFFSNVFSTLDDLDCLADTPLHHPNKNYITHTFRNPIIFEKLLKTDEEEFFYDVNNNVTSIKNETNYDYETSQSFRLKRKTTSTSTSNELIEEIYDYPHDLPTTPFMTDLIQQNRIGSPVKTTQNKIINGISENLSTSEIKYNLINNKVRVSEVEKKKNVNLSTNQEQSFTIEQYDAVGNLLQYSKPNSPKTSYVYAYNHTLPVAKLENIAYNQIPPALITAIQAATDTGTYSEANLISALNALRTSTDANLKNAMITTYTHKPLVGVTSVTDPKGDTQTYEYDSFNRLEFVKDKDGNILSENQYHYRPN